jgi:predicted protein tyrosine phosphatase
MTYRHLAQRVKKAVRFFTNIKFGGMDTYETRVVALSRTEAQLYRSSEPYVVISLSDTDAPPPQIYDHPSLRGRLALHFDDVYPQHCFDESGARLFCEMSQEDAEQIAAFVGRWWGQVATIVVHCHAGLSRSTGVAAAIRNHHGQDERDLYDSPRNPNRHCLALVTEALKRYPS